MTASAQTDGNVTFYEAGGNIEIWGDDADNGVVIEVMHHGYANDAVIRIKGLFSTTINHHAAVQTVVSNLGDLVVDLRDGGENRVFIRDLTAYQVDGSLQVLGAGGDVIGLEDSKFDDIEIEGVSFLVAERSEARTHFTVSPTPSADTFEFDDCKADVLKVETKGGNDLVKVSDGVYDELIIDTGAGSPVLSRQTLSKRTVGKPVQLASFDQDVVELSRVLVNEDLDVHMGAGNDELETEEVWIQGHTRIDGGGGVDVANLNGDYDESNAPEGPTEIQGGIVIPWPGPVIEELSVNPTIEILGFETVLNFDNDN
jgi:hypothetical protein